MNILTSRNVVCLLAIAVLAFSGAVARRSRFDSRAKVNYYYHEGLQIGPCDFGDVELTKAFAFDVGVTNTSSRPVTVEDVTASCSCTSVSPTTFEIQPREKVVLHLVIDLTTESPSANRGCSPPFSVQVRARVRGTKDEQIKWPITGRIMRSLIASPGSTDFGRSVLGEEIPPKLVKIETCEPIDQVNVESGQQMFTTDILKEDSSLYTVRIRPKADLAIGRHSCELALTGVRSDGTTTGACLLPVVISVVPDVYILQDPLVVGPLAVGKSIARRVDLQSHSGEPFIVESFDCARSDRVDVCAVAIDEGDVPRAAHGFTIEVTAQKAGAGVAGVKFVVRRQDNAFSVPLRISYSCASIDETSTAVGHPGRSATDLRRPSLEK